MTGQKQALPRCSLEVQSDLLPVSDPQQPHFQRKPLGTLPQGWSQTSLCSALPALASAPPGQSTMLQNCSNIPCNLRFCSESVNKAAQLHQDIVRSFRGQHKMRQALPSNEQIAPSSPFGSYWLHWDTDLLHNASHATYMQVSPHSGFSSDHKERLCYDVWTNWKLRQQCHSGASIAADFTCWSHLLAA